MGTTVFKNALRLVATAVVVGMAWLAWKSLESADQAYVKSYMLVAEQIHQENRAIETKLAELSAKLDAVAENQAADKKLHSYVYMAVKQAQTGMADTGED